MLIPSNWRTVIVPIPRELALGSEGDSATNVKMRLGTAFDEMMGAWCEQRQLSRHQVRFEVGKRVVIAKARPMIEDRLEPYGLAWADVEPPLLKITSLDEIKVGG